MPDRRHHRGPHPDDASLFAPSVWPVLREAVADYCWLLSHGYASNSSLKLVGDRYELVSNGVTTIDLHPFTHFYFTKMHELLKYYAHANLMMGFHACIFVNLDVWNKLSPELQRVFEDAGLVAEDEMNYVVMPYWWKECVKEFKAAGVQFSHFPESEFKRWAGTLKDVPAEWAAEVSKKGYPGYEIVAKWQEITASEGYNWARQWGKK